MILRQLQNPTISNSKNVLLYFVHDVCGMDINTDKATGVISGMPIVVTVGCKILSATYHKQPPSTVLMALKHITSLYLFPLWLSFCMSWYEFCVGVVGQWHWHQLQWLEQHLCSWLWWWKCCWWMKVKIMCPAIWKFLIFLMMISI